MQFNWNDSRPYQEKRKALRPSDLKTPSCLKLCPNCKKLRDTKSFEYILRGKKALRKKCEECFKEDRRKRQRAWCEKHREKHNAKSRDYRNKKYREDSEFRERVKAESKENYIYRIIKDVWRKYYCSRVERILEGQANDG